MKSLKGYMLISSPEMPDSDFAQTVILLVEHAEDGAYGLVLNRPTQLTVREAWAQNNESPCENDGLVYAGGPCGEYLTVLHTRPEFANIEVASGVHFTQEPARLVQLVRRRVAPIKFFVGFAGWGRGQLENEFADRSWLVTPALAEHVFSYGDELWPGLVREIVGGEMMSAMKIKHRPEDPSEN
jgi:putative transcriptional regulator